MFENTATSQQALNSTGTLWDVSPHVVQKTPEPYTNHSQGDLSTEARKLTSEVEQGNTAALQKELDGFSIEERVKIARMMSADNEADRQANSSLPKINIDIEREPQTQAEKQSGVLGPEHVMDISVNNHPQWHGIIGGVLAGVAGLFDRPTQVYGAGGYSLDRGDNPFGDPQITEENRVRAMLTDDQNSPGGSGLPGDAGSQSEQQLSDYLQKLMHKPDLFM